MPDVYGPVVEQHLSVTYTFEDENASQAACVSTSFYPTIGHNLWVTVRKVDTEVNATANFDGH
jgi:hypothetical protein